MKGDDQNPVRTTSASVSDCYPASPVLIVGDAFDTLASYESSCKYDGINNLLLCQDSRLVRPIVADKKISLAILDLSLPGGFDPELMNFITERYPEIPVIIIAVDNAIESAVTCVRQGAFDYLVKPVERKTLSTAIHRALRAAELAYERGGILASAVSHELEHPEAFKEIVTANTTMYSIFKYLETISCSSKPILITGESGVGKELVARAMYRLCKHTGAFIALNVAGLDDTLFSDTMVGHNRGAFSGADSERRGMLQAAGNGVLFLDEIGDLNPASQIKLLRLLQEREFFPLGSDTSLISSARIITATNADIRELVKTKKFRKDLYYRLSIHHIHIPALRDRPEDITPLTGYFVTEASATLGKTKPRIPRGLPERLRRYSFPGNVRELQSMLFDAVAQCRSNSLSMEYFDSSIKRNAPIYLEHASDTERIPSLKEATLQLMIKALRKTGFNQSQAAELLGISQSTISRRWVEIQSRISSKQ